MKTIFSLALTLTTIGGFAQATHYDNCTPVRSDAINQNAVVSNRSDSGIADYTSTRATCSSDVGEALNSTGSRNGSVKYYVDGMPMREAPMLTGAIEQISIITGGIPARYGDASNFILPKTGSREEKTKIR